MNDPISDPEQCGEREINSFTIDESVDYILNALNDGDYQDAYKDYLIDVLEHIKNTSQITNEQLTKQYLKRRFAESSNKMGRNTGNGQLYEFYKGQFLAFREALDPKYWSDK